MNTTPLSSRRHLQGRMAGFKSQHSQPSIILFVVILLLILDWKPRRNSIDPGSNRNWYTVQTVWKQKMVATWTVLHTGHSAIAQNLTTMSTQEIYLTTIVVTKWIEWIRLYIFYTQDWAVESTWLYQCNLWVTTGLGLASYTNRLWN